MFRFLTKVKLVETFLRDGACLLRGPQSSLRSASSVSESNRNKRWDIKVLHLCRENGLFRNFRRGSVPRSPQDGHRTEDHLRVWPSRVAKVCRSDHVFPEAGASVAAVLGRSCVAFAFQVLYGQLSPIGISRNLKCHFTIPLGVGEELSPCAP